MLGVESYSPGFLAKSKGKIAQNEQKTRKTEENEQKSEVFPPFFSLIRFFLLILHPNNKSVINMKTNFRQAYIKDFAAYFLHGCASGGECSRRCGYGVGVCSWRECSYKEG